MSKISVSVTDGTNINLTVSPRPTQTITVSRGSYGAVTSVTGTGEVSGITLSGSGTQDVTLTLGGALDLSEPPVIGATTPNDIYANYITANNNILSYGNITAEGIYSNNLVTAIAQMRIFGSDGYAGNLSIYDGDNNSNIILGVPDIVPVPYTLKLPATLGTNTQALVISNSTTGQLSFADSVSSITSTDNSITVTGTNTRNLSVASSPNVIVEVRNNTGATLTKGTAVYINGAIGQLPTVTKAQANTDAASAQTLGLMTTDLANNANGYVTIIGLITNINTSAYTDGQQLYLSPTVAGGLTATKPSAPQHLVYVAVVEHAHITQGKLFVKVQNGYELDELHDVQITSPANGQTLTYDSATSLWKNTTPTSGGVTSVSGTGTVSGISLSGTVTSTGSITLGGSLNLSSPPAIGGTTPNTITGTTVNVTTQMLLPTVTAGNSGVGVLQMIDGGDGYDYLNIYSYDNGDSYAVNFPGGLSAAGNIASGGFSTTGNVIGSQFLAYGDGTYSGSISINDSLNSFYIGITAPTTLTTSYTLKLPTTAGSANQVLTTDGSGNLSWSIGGGSSYYRNNATTNTISGTAVTAGSFVAGTAYSIVTLGTTNWNNVGYVGTAAACGIFVANGAGTGTGTATPLLSASGVANGVTLAANTIYQIEGECYMSSTGTTSHTMTAGLRFSGGLTMSDMFVSIQRFGGVSTPGTTAANNFTTGTGNPSNSAIITTSGVMLYISYSIATATYNSYRFSGTIAVGTGGSLNPVFAYTTASPGGTLTANPKSWFKATPIGTTGSNVSIGTWT